MLNHLLLYFIRLHRLLSLSEYIINKVKERANKPNCYLIKMIKTGQWSRTLESLAGMRSPSPYPLGHDWKRPNIFEQTVYCDFFNCYKIKWSYVFSLVNKREFVQQLYFCRLRMENLVLAVIYLLGPIPYEMVICII